MPKDNNNKLMQLVQKDDLAAFKQLMEQNLQSASAFVERMTQNIAMTEDIVQEGFLRVWLNRQKWQEKANFKTWFFKILYHLCIDTFRENCHYEQAQLDAIAADNNLLEGEINTIEELDRLKEALKAIKEEDKAILFLYYFHGIKQEDLANMLNLTTSAVETSLFRTRQKLKKVLQ